MESFRAKAEPEYGTPNGVHKPGNSEIIRLAPLHHQAPDVSQWVWTGRNQELVQLAPVVTVFLIALHVMGCAVSAWLVLVYEGTSDCTGKLCDAATLGGHATLTLFLALGSCMSLALQAAMTRAFTRATRPQLICLIVAAFVCAVAIAGAVLITVLLTAVVMVCVAILFGASQSASHS